MTGTELRDLIRHKWGYSYDVQLRHTQGKLWLQIMWRYQEQVSFPMTEVEFCQHLDGITTYLRDWGVSEQVLQFVTQTKQKPRLGKAINVPLQVGDRAREWILE
ncbi:MAG: DUF3067 family protein [Oscillatoriales cyanobacterium SM2_2_1]|nr:DUF3067 family protein [Oscillatoriales cyanobacterium SM2_2_1]